MYNWYITCTARGATYFELLKRFFKGLGLGVAGLISSIPIVFTKALGFVGMSIALPYMVAKTVWDSEIGRGLFAPLRFLFSGLFGLMGSGIALVLVAPFAAIGLAIYIPLRSVYLAVSRGWQEGVVSPLKNSIGGIINALGAMIFNLRQAMNPERDAGNPINDSQSVHQASVHQGVDAILSDWKEKYKNIDMNGCLEQIKKYRDNLAETNAADIKRFKENNLNVQLNLPETSFIRLLFANSNAGNNQSVKNSPEIENIKRTQAAIRFLDRVINSTGFMNNPYKDIPLKNIVALVFHHIQQPSNRPPGATQKDVNDNFVRNLYEIQRAYNLNDKEIDDNTPDRVTCFGGTVNKLVYGMQGSARGFSS